MSALSPATAPEKTAPDKTALARTPVPGTLHVWSVAIFKGILPWALIVLVWESAALSGWSGATLFPPPSSFIRYAVESDFRIGFGNEAMTTPTCPASR
jgi:hypothetical protein